MRKDYEKLFAHLTPVAPPENLFFKIMQGIKKEQRLSAVKQRLIFFSSGVVVSLVAFIPIFRSAKTALFESGFLQFLSLIVTDFGAVAASWQNFVMSLLETIPAISLAMLFTAVFIFLGSLKFLAKDLKIILAFK